MNTKQSKTKSITFAAICALLAFGLAGCSDLGSSPFGFQLTQKGETQSPSTPGEVSTNNSDSQPEKPAKNVPEQKIPEKETPGGGKDNQGDGGTGGNEEPGEKTVDVEKGVVLEICFPTRLENGGESVKLSYISGEKDSYNANEYLTDLIQGSKKIKPAIVEFLQRNYDSQRNRYCIIINAYALEELDSAGGKRIIRYRPVPYSDRKDIEAFQFRAFTSSNDKTLKFNKNDFEVSYALVNKNELIKSDEPVNPEDLTNLKFTKLDITNSTSKPNIPNPLKTALAFGSNSDDMRNVSPEYINYYISVFTPKGFKITVKEPKP